MHNTNRLALMWILHGKFEDELITDLGKAALLKRGFSTAFLLSDTWDVLDAHNAMEMAHNERINQTHLKDDTQKHNKANNQVICTNAIYHRTANEGARTT